jgi:hypothetical protein
MPKRGRKKLTSRGRKPLTTRAKAKKKRGK